MRHAFPPSARNWCDDSVSSERYRTRSFNTANAMTSMTAATPAIPSHGGTGIADNARIARHLSWVVFVFRRGGRSTGAEFRLYRDVEIGRRISAAGIED